MALHNYIYTKHPHDLVVDNKIARTHDPRPTVIKGTEIEHAALVEKPAVAPAVVVAVPAAKASDAGAELEMGLGSHIHAETKDMHHLEDDSDDDEDVERRNDKSDYESDVETDALQPAVNADENTNEGGNTPSSPATPQQKWVYVHGRKRKLKPRFRKPNDP